ncbi:MAG: aldo/keto reductase [Candidatus Omnitrophota bacterium]
MEYIKIPKTDLNVSAITLGTWVFGGESWGGAKDEESIQAVHQAIECGINTIDTAPIYGDGHSEEIVGKAIKNRRDQVILATKCGLIKKGKQVLIDLSPASVQKEIDDSLRRLNVDQIDLYQCHWPDKNTPIQETMETLLALKDKKKIRYIGVSNFDLNLLKESRKNADVVTQQVQYSMLERSIEKDILPYCQKQEIGILTYGVLAGGILSGKYAQEKNFQGSDARSFLYPYYRGEKFIQTKACVDAIRKIGKPPYETAINWVRQQPGVTSVIVGCRNAEQVRMNAQAAQWTLSEDQIQLLSQFKFS